MSVEKELEVGDRVEVTRDTTFTHGRDFRGRAGVVAEANRVPFPSSAVYSVVVQLDGQDVLLRAVDVKEVE